MVKACPPLVCLYSSRMALLWYWMRLWRVYPQHWKFYPSGFSWHWLFRFTLSRVQISLFSACVLPLSGLCPWGTPSDSGDSLCLTSSVSPTFLWNPELTNSLWGKLTSNLGFQFLFSYTRQSWLPVSVSFYLEVEANLFTLIITSYRFQVKYATLVFIFTTV